MGDAAENEGQATSLRTLQRGLRVLEAIAQSPSSELSARELAQQFGLPLRTCYSLIERLCEEGYVTHFLEGRYGLGPKLEELQRVLSFRLAPDKRILGSFAHLHERVGQISLNGWYGSEIVIQRSYPNWDGEMSLGVGYRDHSTSRCSTKAILAFVDEKRLLQHFASRSHPGITERTITDFQLFKDHLLEVAKQGYALDLAESSHSFCGVAAPFFTAAGFPLGSFGIPVLQAEFDRKRDLLIEAILDACVNASRRLGYTGPYPPPSPLLNAKRA